MNSLMLQNGDGTITFNELSACLSSEQYSTAEIKSIMLNLDTDGDGVICESVFSTCSSRGDTVWLQATKSW